MKRKMKAFIVLLSCMIILTACGVSNKEQPKRVITAVQEANAPTDDNTDDSLYDVFEDEIDVPKKTEEHDAGEWEQNEYAYIGNTNTKKFHIPSCSSVSKIKEGNKEYLDYSRDEAIVRGYMPCKRCNP